MQQIADIALTSGKFSVHSGEDEGTFGSSASRR